MKKLPLDEVWPGEERLERLWKKNGGMKKNRMWLTPRMHRMARRMKKQFDAEAEEQTKKQVAE